VRLWTGARASNYLSPFFNVVVSNVPGPRQTMYCVGAPATHYFPVSIPYHGCALNITVQSYLDQLDFGLIACSDTVPDAQRIADFIVEDFAAMRKANEELGRPEAVETIALAPAAATRLAAHKPIALGEATVESPAPKVEKASALTQQIDALSEATEALRRRLAKAQPAEPAKTRAVRPKATTKRKRAAAKAGAAPRTRRTVQSGRGRAMPQSRPRSERGRKRVGAAQSEP
jgi:hypothetical protein